MKSIHYKVIIKYMKYREPYPDFGIKDAIIYESLEEVLQKFPTFRKHLEPPSKERFLVGNDYDSITLSHIQLTEEAIDKKRPTEKELQEYYITHDEESYKNYY